MTDGTQLQKVVKLYSDSLDFSDRDLVRRIVARKGGSFCSSVFRPLDHEHERSEWVEARKDTATGLWFLLRVTNTKDIINAGRGEVLEDTKTIAKNICFFDALYWVAEYDAGMKARPDMSGEQPDDNLPTWFRDFAERESIFFDRKTDLPMAAANGRLMADGLLAPAERRAALAARGNLAAQAPAHLPAVLGERSMPILPEALPGKTRTAQALERVEQSVGHKSFVADAHNAVERISGAAGYAKSGDYLKVSADAKELSVFAGGTAALGATSYTLASLVTYNTGALLFLGATLTGVGALMGGVLTAIGVVVCLKGGVLRSPRGHFKSQMRRYYDFADSLADGTLRAHLRKQGQDIEVAFHVLVARDSFKKAAAANGWRAGLANGRMKKDFNTLATLTARYNYTDDETAALIEAIRKDPETADFENRVSAAMNAKLEEIKAFFSSMKQEDIGPNPYRTVKVYPMITPYGGGGVLLPPPRR